MRAGAQAPALFVLDDDGRTLLSLHARDLSEQGRQTLPQRLTAFPAPGLAGGDDGGLLALRPDGRARAWRKAGDGPCRAATSADGRWHLVLPAERTGRAELLLLDTALVTVKSWALPGPVAWLLDAPRRRAFVLALTAPAQVWVISYDERAEDFYEGLVHDFRMGEGVAQRGFHNPRRMNLPEPLLAATADAEDTEFAGRGLVFNLDVRRVVQRSPRLQPGAAGSAAVFARDGAGWMAVPVAGVAAVDCWRTGDWTLQARIPTDVPPAAVLAHRGVQALVPLPRAQAERAELVPIDTRTLQPLSRLALPGPVREAAFGADGRELYVRVGGAAAGVACIDTAGWTLRVHRPLAQPLAQQPAPAR
ncbi:MAG: hypothetical protein LC119_09870 [Burkholderiales bacterium]|nr:hypothetical protein [Burkholderiales bacterium]